MMVSYRNLEQEVDLLQQQYRDMERSLKHDLKLAREIASKYEDRYFAAQQRIEELEAEIARLTAIPGKITARRKRPPMVIEE